MGWDDRPPTKLRRAALISALSLTVTLAACGSPARPSLRTTTTVPASRPGPVSAPKTTTRSIAPGATGPPRVQPTEVDTFAPFTATGTLSPDVKVSGRIDGSCFTTSSAVAVRGAYRCISGNGLYDPCFAPPGGRSHTVACAGSPWSGVVLMTLTKALPPDTIQPGNPLTYPWAIQLTNGQRCVVGTGTNPVLRGVVLAFDCFASKAVARPIVRTSEPNETVEPWTVRYSPGPGELDPGSVAVAWD